MPLPAHRFRVDRAGRWPFLVLIRLTEEDQGPADVELSGDEVEDYEQTLRAWARWQERLSDI